MIFVLPSLFHTYHKHSYPHKIDIHRIEKVLSNTFQQQASPKQRRKRTSETSHDEHEQVDRPSSLPERQKLLITSQSDTKSALSEPITAGERVRIGSVSVNTIIFYFQKIIYIFAGLCEKYLIRYFIFIFINLNVNWMNTCIFFTF